VRIERDYGGGDVQVAYAYGYNSDGVRVWKRDVLAGQEYRYLCRIECGGMPMRVLRILSILVLCLIMISCRQRVLHLSDPAGWTVVSRELVYKRADGTVITEYVDEKQFRLALLQRGVAMWNNPCGGKHLCERADLSVLQNSLTTSPNKHFPPTPTQKADTTTPFPSASPA